MKVFDPKRQNMMTQIEAAHIMAIALLRKVYTSQFAQAVLGSADNVNVIFSERMSTCGGYALMKRIGNTYGKLTIKLNARLMEMNPDELIPTYLHELAHIIANLMIGKSAGHGPVWKDVMVSLGLEPDRCHAMDVSALTRSPKRHEYTCDKCLKVYHLTGHKHRKQQNAISYFGFPAYNCKCGGCINEKT